MSTESQEGQVIIHDWAELDDLKGKCLWHQLSLKVLDIAKSPECEREEMAKDLYCKYIQGMESRMNQSLLAEVCYHLADHYQKPQEAVTLLENAEKKMSAPADEAVALCKILRAEILFSRMNDMEQSKSLLDEAEALLDGIPISKKIHGRYYLLAYKWHKKQGDPSQVYKNGLRYLGIVDIEALPAKEQVDMSRTLAVAAMIAEDVYNIGELICNPVSTSLKESKQCSWLYQLMLQLETGRLSGLQSFQDHQLEAPELWDNWTAIQQKSRLLNLVQIFNMGRRRVKLEEIGNTMKLSTTDVEDLLMMAMTKGLVKGQIDEPSGVVSISWVQPKPFTKPQLNLPISKMEEWIKEVEELEMHFSEPVSEYPESTPPRVTDPSNKTYSNYNF